MKNKFWYFFAIMYFCVVVFISIVLYLIYEGIQNIRGLGTNTIITLFFVNEFQGSYLSYFQGICLLMWINIDNMCNNLGAILFALLLSMVPILLVCLWYNMKIYKNQKQIKSKVRLENR